MIRPAGPDDAGILARVKDMATEGLGRLTRMQGTADPAAAEAEWWAEARAAFSGVAPPVTHLNCLVAEVGAARGPGGGPAESLTGGPVAGAVPGGVSGKGSPSSTSGPGATGAVAQTAAGEPRRNFPERPGGRAAAASPVGGPGTGPAVAGAILAYPRTDAPEITDDTPPLFRPLLDLLAGAAGSFYVDSVAVMPEYRGLGLARALLHGAEARARAAGLSRLTLIVLSSNAPALPLYDDEGYVEARRRDLIPSYWAPEAEAAMLMEKSLR